MTVDEWDLLSKHILESKSGFEKAIYIYMKDLINSYIVHKKYINSDGFLYKYLQIKFPSTLSSNQRHLIHRYSRNNEIKTYSIYDVNNNKYIKVTLYEKYIVTIYNKFKTTNQIVEVPTVSVVEVPTLQTVPEIPVHTVVNIHDTTLLLNPVDTAYDSCSDSGLDEDSNNGETNTPEVSDEIMKEIADVLNKTHIELYKPYTLTETIANLEFKINSYTKDLELLKSIQQSYGDRLALELKFGLTLKN